MYLHIHICLHIHVYIYTYIYIYVHMHICMYICVDIYTYTHIHMCVYMYTSSVDSDYVGTRGMLRFSTISGFRAAHSHAASFGFSVRLCRIHSTIEQHSATDFVQLIVHVQCLRTTVTTQVLLFLDTNQNPLLTRLYLQRPICNLGEFYKEEVSCRLR